MVNFEWYRSFIAVYRTGTVTAAANARALTQPAISQHIATLEAAMKQPLFRRTARKMIPTEHGKNLYSRLAPAVDGLENLAQNLKYNLATDTPVIRIGTPLEYFDECALARIKDVPMRFQIAPGDTEALIDALILANLDIVIATQHLSAKEIDYAKMDTEEFCLVAPPYFELPSKNRTKTASGRDFENYLLEQKWIAYSVELPIIRRFWHMAFRHRPDIEPRMVVPSLLLIRKAVELGMGISVLPRYLCEQSIKTNKLKLLWQTEKPILNDLWLATRKIDRNRQEIKQLIALLKSP
jgi:DNA-binding transcriptional LysR family regulator